MTLVYQRYRFFDDPRHDWPENLRPLMHGDHMTGQSYDREHYAYILDRVRPKTT